MAACSGGGGGSPPPPPPPANVAPTVSVNVSNAVVEGDKTVATYSVQDSNGDTIQISLSGEDAGFFEIVDETISFRAPVDFDTPQDADSDNLFKATLTASDGALSTSADFEIQLEDLPFDGIVKIEAVDWVSSAGDLNNDGLNDFAIAPRRARAADEVPTALVGPGIVGSLLSREAGRSEQSVSASTRALSESFDSLTLTANQSSDSFAGWRFFDFFYRVGADILHTPLIRTLRLVDVEGDLTRETVTDDTGLFVEGSPSLLSPGAELDLSNDILPSGVRSTRDLFAFSFSKGRTLGGAYLPIGDLNGDGTSEVTLTFYSQRLFVPSGQPALAIVDGDLYADGDPGLMFGAVSEATVITFRNSIARTMKFDPVTYVDVQSSFDDQPYRAPGSADIDGDGVDDVVFVVGLRGTGDLNSATPQGFEIIVFSGTYIMALPPGEYDYDDHKDAVYKIELADGFAYPRITGVGDLNSDGYADIVIEPLNSKPDYVEERFEIYVVSGESLVNDLERSLSIVEDFPGRGGTGIRVASNESFADNAFIATGLFEADSESLAVTHWHYMAGSKSKLITVVMTGEMFADGFPERIDLADQQTGSLVDGISQLSPDTYVRIDGPIEESYVLRLSDGNYRFGEARARGSSTHVSDGDGDGNLDLALLLGSREPFSDASQGGVHESDLYIIPSGRLAAALRRRQTIDLEIEFAD